MNGDPYGNRTHVCGVRGRRLNRLTNGPCHASPVRNARLPFDSDPEQNASRSSVPPRYSPFGLLTTARRFVGTDGKVSGIRSSPDLLTAPRLVGAGAFYMGMSRPVHVGPGPSVKTAYAGLTVWNLSPKMCCRGRRPRRPAPPVPATPDKRRAGSSRPTRVLSQAPPAAIPLSRVFWSSYGTQV